MTIKNQFLTVKLNPPKRRYLTNIQDTIDSGIQQSAVDTEILEARIHTKISQESQKNLLEIGDPVTEMETDSNDPQINCSVFDLEKSPNPDLTDFSLGQNYENRDCPRVLRSHKSRSHFHPFARLP